MKIFTKINVFSVYFFKTKKGEIIMMELLLAPIMVLMVTLLWIRVNFKGGSVGASFEYALNNVLVLTFVFSIKDLYINELTVNVALFFIVSVVVLTSVFISSKQNIVGLVIPMVLLYLTSNITSFFNLIIVPEMLNMLVMLFIGLYYVEIELSEVDAKNIELKFKKEVA